MGHSSWMVVLFGVTAIACGDPGAGESPDDAAETVRRSKHALESEVRLLPVPAGTTSSVAYAVNERDDILGGVQTVVEGETRGGGALWNKHDRLSLLPVSPYVLNDHRVMAGQMHDVTNDLRGYAWSKRRGLVVLDVIAPPDSGHTDAPMSINNRGTIAGLAEIGFDGDTRRAVRWDADDGTIEVLPMLPGATAAEAYGINDAGVVVGVYKFPAIERGMAVRWTRDGDASLLEPFPADVLHSSAVAINERGEILVQVSRETGIGYGIFRTDETFDNLPMPEGHVDMRAMALNDSGLVGGVAMLADGSPHPFVWDRDQAPIPLPLPAGALSAQVLSLNDRGTAVGLSYFGGDAYGATAWTLRCDR